MRERAVSVANTEYPRKNKETISRNRAEKVTPALWGGRLDASTKAAFQS